MILHIFGDDRWGKSALTFFQSALPILTVLLRNCVLKE